MCSKPTWMPLFVDVQKRRVVIVGGGRIAARKLAKVPTGCRWIVIAPVVAEAIRERMRTDAGHWEARTFRPTDVQAGDLVIGAVDDSAVGREIAAAAAAVGAWYNDASDVDGGDVLLPASGGDGAVTWAVSTGGAAPRLLKLLKDDWDRQYGMLGTVAADLAQWRTTVKALLPTQKLREQFWRRCLPEDTLARVRRGEWEQIKEEMEDAISRLRVKS